MSKCYCWWWVVLWSHVWNVSHFLGWTVRSLLPQQCLPLCRLQDAFSPYADICTSFSSAYARMVSGPSWGLRALILTPNGKMNVGPSFSHMLSCWWLMVVIALCAFPFLCKQGHTQKFKNSTLHDTEPQPYSLGSALSWVFPRRQWPVCRIFWDMTSQC